MSDIQFYCGVGEKSFNHHPVHTGPHACISPVTGRGGTDKQGRKRKQKENSISVPSECTVILDSGAFSDTTYHRCTFEEALERQVSHARKFGYLHQVSHMASYDVLIDEQDKGGSRVKDRWSTEIADFAVSKTIQAAQYITSQRERLQKETGHPVGFVLSAQGVDTEQYLRCAEQILPYLDPETDVFGLGGWCILGMQPKWLPTFFETMYHLVPMLKAYKVKRAHIWGVCFAKALGPLLYACDHYQRRDGLWGCDEKHRIQLSTDSVGPTTRIVKEMSSRPGFTAWGYASWREARPLAHVLESCKTVDVHGHKAPSCSPDTYCRGLQRAAHVDATRQWLAHFREQESTYYSPDPLVTSQLQYQQLPLWEVAQ
jgi:hypothetical protein